MTELKLTKRERKAVVHWLNGAGGDNDYFITRPTGNTHVKRTTVRLPGSKWKVRLAYEADTGFPLATGSPIQAEKAGKHDEQPGKQTIPNDHPIKQPTPSPWSMYLPKPNSKMAASLTKATLDAAIEDLKQGMKQQVNDDWWSKEMLEDSGP